MLDHYWHRASQVALKTSRMVRARPAVASYGQCMGGSVWQPLSGAVHTCAASRLLPAWSLAADSVIACTTTGLTVPSLTHALRLSVFLMYHMEALDVPLSDRKQQVYILRCALHIAAATPAKQHVSVAAPFTVI